MKTKPRGNFIRATYSGPKPGDFALGSMKSRAAARAILAADADLESKSEMDELEPLTPHEKALIEDCANDNVKILMVRLFRIAHVKARVFEQALPLTTPEEIRHNRAEFKKSIE